MPVKAVVDTNIWVSGLLNPGISRQIADSLEANLFTLACCNELIDELIRVLKRRTLAIKIHKDRAERLIGLIRRKAVFIELKHIPAVSRDPKDDVFLACAADSQSEFLVSGDNDLLCLGEYAGIKIVTPAQFLDMLKS